MSERTGTLQESMGWTDEDISKMAQASRDILKKIHEDPKGYNKPETFEDIDKLDMPPKMKYAIAMTLGTEIGMEAVSRSMADAIVHQLRGG